MMPQTLLNDSMFLVFEYVSLFQKSRTCTGLVHFACSLIRLYLSGEVGMLCVRPAASAREMMS